MQRDVGWREITPSPEPCSRRCNRLLRFMLRVYSVSRDAGMPAIQAEPSHLPMGRTGRFVPDMIQEPGTWSEATVTFIKITVPRSAVEHVK